MVNTNFLVDPLTDSEPKFAVGQIVQHVHFGYRGVIVAADGHCKADPSWYFSNQSQPKRDQPWYHVLVDQTAECTYPAEENLVADESGLPVEHPLLSVYFFPFKNGHYKRNKVLWPAD
ncbi:heat shock protein HspQ [Calycomorphotria hydatis]|nr:heat shock protein HspQ [Calycomorphotria hydatis]